MAKYDGPLVNPKYVYTKEFDCELSNFLDSPTEYRADAIVNHPPESRLSRIKNYATVGAVALGVMGSGTYLLRELVEYAARQSHLT